MCDTFHGGRGSPNQCLLLVFKIKSIFSNRNLYSEVSCQENCNKKAIMRLLPWVLLLILILESFIFPHNQISLIFKPGFFSFPSLFTFTMPLATFSKLNLLDISKDKVLQKMKWWLYKWSSDGEEVLNANFCSTMLLKFLSRLFYNCFCFFHDQTFFEARCDSDFIITK